MVSLKFKLKKISISSLYNSFLLFSLLLDQFLVIILVQVHPVSWQNLLHPETDSHVLLSIPMVACSYPIIVLSRVHRGDYIIFWDPCKIEMREPCSKDIKNFKKVSTKH